MEKETRSAIEAATQKARRLLEADFQEQLDGVFDVRSDGRIGAEPGEHLDAGQRRLRRKIVATIEHKRAGGMRPAEAVADYVRDAAFTVLNRFVALKMLEARDLVQPCVSQGEASSGFNEFCGLAPGVRTPDGAGYRLYLECIFDELSTEVKVLFDRRDAPSALWPRRAAFLELLEILNAPALASVWAEDETIGWVYQYFNGQEERRAMRAESQAPQNSRELAIRNQFFTPRYVVQFLTDNTLGRIWYEMRDGKTALADQCEYMVRRPDESWVPRARKDPRDIRVLDPACGSGHFLLYAFDLLVTIYEEAWADEASPPSEVTGASLAEDYADIDALELALPGLILAHNLHGVDIDPRCAQIAQLALWMRAQRAFQQFGVERNRRPAITKSNIVIAEPMPGEADLRDEFLRDLSGERLAGLMRRALNIPHGSPVRATKAMADSLAALVAVVWDGMKLAGEMGVLLKIEQTIKTAIEKGRREWEQELPLFRVAEYGMTASGQAPVREQVARLVPGEVDDFWSKAERIVFRALQEYADAARGMGVARRRLFADDAAHGFALIDLVSKKFDALLMNPPFGEATPAAKRLIDDGYAHARNDIYATFVARAASLSAKSGAVGVLSSRAFVVGRDHRHFRRLILSGPGPALKLFLDLGAGVLDAAMVETSAYVLMENDADILFVDARAKPKHGLLSFEGCPTVRRPSGRFLNLPSADLVYELTDDELESMEGSETIEPGIGRVTFGLTTKSDPRFVRLRWEISEKRIAPQMWSPFSKGGEYSWFTCGVHLLVKQHNEAKEMAAFADLRDGNVASTRRSSAYYYRPAISFSRRSQKGFSARRHPPAACFSDKTAVIVPADDKQEWLWALPAALASSEYQRLIEAQSKFGSYEIGPIKALPVPPTGLLGQGERWKTLFDLFDGISAADETSEGFQTPKSDGWRAAKIALEGLELLERGLAECGLSLDGKVKRHILADATELDRGRDVQHENLSWKMGCAFGRFGAASAEDGYKKAADSKAAAILADDEGSEGDVLARMDLEPTANPTQVRQYLRTEFFSRHLKQYSASNRKAPIYWQLATHSASYSVWVYIHAFTKDTLFRIQNEYVAPKLAHERRQLESLLAEAGPSPSSAQARAIEGQETFVEELSALLDEVRRVAPLWDPDLDDGVLLNFAPLLRLVPQNRAWQKELRAAWASLVAGDYDWARLAMRLWPKRVLPKCAKDRSLAIAHDLEDVFWFEDAAGKWQPRSTPSRPINELIAERTSPAVEAALQSLLEAPDLAAASGRGRRRRNS